MDHGVSAKTRHTNYLLRFVFFGVVAVTVIGPFSTTQRLHSDTSNNSRFDESFGPPGAPIKVKSQENRLDGPNCMMKKALDYVAKQPKDMSDYNVVNGVKAVSPDLAPLNVTVLRQPKARGELRIGWSRNEPISESAKLIAQHQSNCALPVANFDLDNLFGIGAHIALWSQAVCHAMDARVRMRTLNPEWLWLDRTSCDMELAKQSPFLCYFPSSEFLCGCGETVSFGSNVTNPRTKNKAQNCSLLKGKGDDVLRTFRAASTEYLFRTVSPLVIREAERQAGLLFGHGQKAPKDLITVHIRWGDKFWEMDLAPIEEYVQAVSELLRSSGKSNETANIYVATEDPKVVAAFKNETPPGWQIYYDRTVEELTDFRPSRGNRASHMSRNTNGRAGLVGLGSLLLAMEAKMFVLTTKSNWSRLMDHLRTNVIDPRCGGCTRMIDLRPGVW